MFNKIKEWLNKEVFVSQMTVIKGTGELTQLSTKPSQEQERLQQTYTKEEKEHWLSYENGLRNMPMSPGRILEVKVSSTNTFPLGGLLLGAKQEQQADPKSVSTVELAKRLEKCPPMVLKAIEDLIEKYQEEEPGDEASHERRLSYGGTAAGRVSSIATPTSATNN